MVARDSQGLHQGVSAFFGSVRRSWSAITHPPLPLREDLQEYLDSLPLDDTPLSVDKDDVL
eukprot:2004366-Amphidinium_carterae.1